MPSTIQSVRSTNGKIGELLVELELTARGWHVERLDGSSKAVNADLIAIKGRERKVIQVKTNGTQRDRGYLGHAGAFLSKDQPFFNGRGAPIEADIVVSVSGDRFTPVFHVFKVEEAEAFAQRHAREWFARPKIRGGTRSTNFPVSPKHDELTAFVDAWEKLETHTLIAAPHRDLSQAALLAIDVGFSLTRSTTGLAWSSAMMRLPPEQERIGIRG